MTPRSAFWSAFVALLLVASIWAVSNPLMASVDEPSHATKAAATVLGSEDRSADGYRTGIGEVVVPSTFLQLAQFPNCLVGQPTQPASCQPELTGDLDAMTPVLTSAINYNPLYYAVVGLPVLLPSDGAHTLYLMRLVNAVVAAVVLAMAARTIVELPRRRWLGLGLVLAITPTIVNLLGSVNPQSIEVAGIVLLWVALLALLKDPRPELLVRRSIRVGLGALLVANSRGMGPFFVTLVVVLCLLVVPWRQVRTAFADRRVWWAVAGGVAACAIGTVWILRGGALPSYGPVDGLSFRDAVLYTVGNTSTYLLQLMSATGWMEVPFPMWVYLVMSAAVGFVGILAWALGTRRERLTLLATGALVIALPIVIETVQAQAIGPFWQGRYIYPVAVGFVLLAGVVVDGKTEFMPGGFQSRIVRLLAPGFALANVAAFVVHLRRMVNGSDGGWFSVDQYSWVPPLPAPVLVVMYTVAWVALTAVCLRLFDSRRDGVELVPPQAIGSTPRQ